MYSCYISIGRNKGSPIRIFTNVDQCKISLPAEENYKFCDDCNRWVCSENVHCYKCNSCTSKVKIYLSVSKIVYYNFKVARILFLIIKYYIDKNCSNNLYVIATIFYKLLIPIEYIICFILQNGRKYIHCNLCKKCVKRTWKHCKQCNKCCLIEHKCNLSQSVVSIIIH